MTPDMQVLVVIFVFGPPILAIMAVGGGLWTLARQPAALAASATEKEPAPTIPAPASSAGGARAATGR